jgi:hypothetical protein
MHEPNPHIKEYPDLPLHRYSLDLRVERDDTQTFTNRVEVKRIPSRNPLIEMSYRLDEFFRVLNFTPKTDEPGYETTTYPAKIIARLKPDRKIERILVPPAEPVTAYFANDRLSIPLSMPTYTERVVEHKDFAVNVIHSDNLPLMDLEAHMTQFKSGFYTYQKTEESWEFNFNRAFTILTDLIAAAFPGHRQARGSIKA